MARKKRVETESQAFDPPEGPSRDEAAKVMGRIVEGSKGFRPAPETLTKVRAVPTIFPYFDWKMRIGGFPLQRVSVAHGPWSMGKTQFAIGLGASFLRRRHIFAYGDAEMTTPMPFVRKLLAEQADNPWFIASRPSSYEEFVDDVRRISTNVADARQKGDVPPDTSCLWVVDSLRKLVPKDLIKRIEKQGASGDKGSVDGYGGRAAQLKAALNAAWLDELTPLMHETGCTMLFIGRESEDINADARDKQFGNDWKLTGGRAIRFDSSLLIRIVRGCYLYDGPRDAGGEAIGEKHVVEIHRTKVSKQQDKVEQACFHTSNGRAFPEGFWRAQDLLSLGKELDIIEQRGSWLSFDGSRWQGDLSFATKATSEQLDAIEQACRAQYRDSAAEIADEVGAASVGHGTSQTDA